jgi:hypothetical protein
LKYADQIERRERGRRKAMTEDHWIEILTCLRCGKRGIAELSQIDAYEGHADLVPPGFKRHGDTFYCVACDVLARSERR